VTPGLALLATGAATLAAWLYERITTAPTVEDDDQ